MFERQRETRRLNLRTSSPVILLLLLSGFWLLAGAQVSNGSQSENKSAHMKDRNKGSSKGKTALKQEITVTLPVPPIQFSSCEVYISFQSHQRNTLARVATTIEPKSCTTSTGEYELSITVKDGNGVHQALKFSETWEQEDDSPIEFSKDYPIGENVTLKRVMAQGLRCECSG